ncbi:MAG: tetratricopeptide repeat protein [Candidatus Nealsonbacteria bacterium]|nr:tetratricopeptide repeat protein [Candidatus Nealsonbacteria bacterium]
MNSKLLKTIIFILILGLYASLLFYKIDFFSLSINDLGRHIQNGRTLLETRDILTTNFYSYTNPDFSFINHHWLSGVIFNFLHSFFGFGGLVVFKIIVLTAAFALVFLAAVKKANFWLVALFSLPTMLILKERAELRPEIFSYLFTAIFIYFLIGFEKNPAGKRIFWLIPLQILWVNLHSFFFVGILLTAGFLLEKILLNLKDFKKLALLLIMLIAACFINPNGIKGALYFLDIFGNYGFRVAENQSLSAVKDMYWWDISIQIFLPLAYLLAFSFLLNIKQRPIFYFVSGLGAAIASFLVIRGLPLFALIFLPAIAFNFNKIFLGIKNHFGNFFDKAMALLLAIILVYAGWALHKTSVISTAAPQERGAGLVEHTNGAITFFKENNLKGPIFNDYNVGSYLIYYLFPEEKVFVDNRPEAYPAAFFQNIYYPILQQEEKWREAEAEYDFNVIFFSPQNLGNEEGIFLINRLSDPAWPLIYADAYSVILLKNTPENEDMIKKFQITRDNINEKINPLLASDKIADRVAAINLFLAMGREDLLVPALQNILEKWPTYSGGWLLLGQLASMQEDEESLKSAISFMQKAIDLGEKTSEAYTYLGLTYFRTGQFEKSEQALKTALQINPNRQDAKNYLSQLQQYLKK